MNEINKIIDDDGSETNDLDNICDEPGKFYNYFSKSGLSMNLAL